MCRKQLSYDTYNKMLTRLWETVGAAEQNERKCRVQGNTASAEQYRQQAAGLLQLIRDLQGGNPYAP